MQDSAAWLGGQMNEAAGIEVILARRSGVQTLTSEPITGTISRHDYDDYDAQGLPLIVEAWDWSFTATDVLLDGVQVEPRNGDRLAATINGEAQVYEVGPVARRKACEKKDSTGIRILVRTKRVAA